MNTLIMFTGFTIVITCLAINLTNQFKIRRVAESTHIIVNNQRTMMLQSIALLTRRIAEDNPRDRKAQEAARIAEENAESKERRVMI